MLTEAGGAPVGRAVTPEEQKRVCEAAASNPEWDHVYRAVFRVLDMDRLARHTRIFVGGGVRR
jgi:hypothetical protein